MPSHSKQRRSPQQQVQSSGPELVDPAFLLKGLGIAFAVALIFAYITLCVIYARGAWQLVLHPSRSVASTPAVVGLRFEAVRFGVDASGEPQLDGWWIPADAANARTVLMLHGEAGNMADALPVAALFHSQGLNVLLFDYRGYGRSGGNHPTQELMQTDAHSALIWLTEQRHLAPASIVVYGHDLGAPLALELCATVSTPCSALVLDAPEGDLLSPARQDPRSRAVPAWLLFHEPFPLAEPLAASTVPKLLLSYSGGSTPTVLREAHDPKMLVTLGNSDTAAYVESVQRFLDAY